MAFRYYPEKNTILLPDFSPQNHLDWHQKKLRTSIYRWPLPTGTPSMKHSTPVTVKKLN
ncbi:hypothetical protein [Flavobacterium enshiense]|uniref:hypothetical protein n=1 Tax=Flavobacterium enshiense TaxID=1341165 RepID=UPI0012DC1F7E|nr:hypothetical protein [Flavobacterium enshiense]